MLAGWEDFVEKFAVPVTAVALEGVDGMPGHIALRHLKMTPC